MSVLSRFLLSLLLLGLITASQASPYPNHPGHWYAGLMAGFGSNDWGSVTAKTDNLEVTAFNLTSYSGQGASFGVFVGYQPFKRFAIEAQYLHMPQSTLALPYLNAYYPLDQNVFNSDMDLLSVIFKIFVPFSATSPWRIYGDAGASYQMRSDKIAKKAVFLPTFGAGLNYFINEQWMAEMGFAYTPGYGKSTETPLYHFLPEIYTANLKLAYVF